MNENENWTAYSACMRTDNIMITIAVSERLEAGLSPAAIMDQIDMVVRGINAQLTKGDVRG